MDPNEVDDDYPLIPRNTPIKGKYMGMEKTEAIIWAVNAAILIPIVFSRDSNGIGILWFFSAAAYLALLWYIFSNLIGGRVMWRYVQDLYQTLTARKSIYYVEQQRGDSFDFTSCEGDSRDWEQTGDREEE
jgi:hypothetical protein